MLAHAAELRLDLGDALADLAAIHLKPCLARAPPSYSSGQTAHCPVLPHQAGHHVLELGHLHLQLALSGLGVLGKDIEDELGAVEDLALRDLAQIALLRRGQLLVKDQRRGVLLQSQDFELGQFAAPQDKLGVDSGHTLHHLPHDFQPGRSRQLRQFGQGSFLRAFRLGRNADKDCGAFPRRCGHSLPRTGQFVLQGLGAGPEIKIHPIPDHGLMHLVGQFVRVGRQQMRDLAGARRAIGAHGQHADGVQAQEGHVHEVFLRQKRGVEVRVQKAQAGQPGVGLAMARELGDEDAVLFPDQDHDRHALAVDQHAKLAADAPAQEGELPGLVGSEPALIGKASVVEAGNGRDLTGFEAREVAKRFGSDGYSPLPALRRQSRSVKSG